MNVLNNKLETNSPTFFPVKPSPITRRNKRISLFAFEKINSKAFQKKRNSMRTLLIVIILLVLNGCTTLLSNLPLPFSLLRTPITVDAGPVNDSLSPEELCILHHIGEEIEKGQFRKKAIETHWPEQITTRQCLRGGFRNGVANSIDSLDDLYRREPLIFVAISGGGARAAVLGAHTMSLLEERYNHLTAEFDVPTNEPMIKLVDAFSTVSGGSIYSHNVAKAKTLFDYRKNINNYVNPDVTSQENNSYHPPPGINFECPSLSLILKDSQLNPSTLEQLYQCFFYYLGVDDVTRELGFLAGSWYLSPGNAFAGPLLTLTTNRNYLDILAGGLSLVSPPNPGEDGSFLSTLRTQSFPASFKIGQISRNPRFFFNTTALEVGLPLVITQRIIHLPNEQGRQRTARLEEHLGNPKPLSEAYTLEEINSSPASFPLAYAAMASAAFPFGIEPLEVSKFGYDHDREEVYESSGSLHLSDGGIYDNSGLTTITNLTNFILSTASEVVEAETKKQKARRPQAVYILSINAEGDDYELDFPKRISPPQPWYDRWLPFKWFDLPLIPIRTDALGVGAVEVIHFTNKRRAEELAIQGITSLNKSLSLKEQCVEVKGVCTTESNTTELGYFPVSFSQLSKYDRFAISDPDDLFSRIKEIPTSYAISEADDILISQAAKLLISSKQKKGWAVGPNCGPLQSSQHSSSPDEKSKWKAIEIRRLDEAFAFALIRRNFENLPALQITADNPLWKRWCNIDLKKQMRD